MGLFIVMLICLVCMIINIHFIVRERNTTTNTIIKMITTVLPFMLVGVKIMVARYIEILK